MDDSNFGMADADVEALRRAKDALENPSLAARLAALLGIPIEEAIKRLPPRWAASINRASEKSLMAALRAALATVERNRAGSQRNVAHRVAVAGTGAAGGFFGLPALAVELPVSTVIMLRSIADVARSEGENLRDLAAQLACLEVFALGGRTKRDDVADSAYYAIRAALAMALSDAAKHFAARGGVKAGAPAVARFIAQVASRFGVVVTQKVAAQAVPVVGAVGGAAVNVTFMKHFQDMAGGHFTVRRLERHYGAERVKHAYDKL
jgi:hypothetical protein